jgi:hypothetical protein
MWAVTVPTANSAASRDLRMMNCREGCLFLAGLDSFSNYLIGLGAWVLFSVERSLEAPEVLSHQPK